MNGSKELLLSLAITAASALALVRLNQKITPARPAEFEAPTAVALAVPDVSVDGWPDPNVSLNWGLSAIGVEPAWRVTRGQSDVVVAIIDTGCDIHHPDLARSIWNNPGETGIDENGLDKSSNGIDDDGNGFVDDAHGWDFVSNSPAIMDDHGHGTHIAGLIAARPLTDASVPGVAPRVSLMILKYYDTESSGVKNMDHTVNAIRYAIRMGAQIINYSGGGILRNAEEERALREAAARGVLIVAAAGNEGMNSDFFHFYPADYDLPNVLSVGAVDRRGDLLPVSNYGLSTVDLVAPGRNIYSTLPNGQHGYMTGTSQATAFASGVAALLMSADERMKRPETLIAHLLTHGRASAVLRGRVGPGQRLDAGLAVITREAPLTARSYGRGPATRAALVESLPTDGPKRGHSELN